MFYRFTDRAGRDVVVNDPHEIPPDAKNLRVLDTEHQSLAVPIQAKVSMLDARSFELGFALGLLPITVLVLIGQRYTQRSLMVRCAWTPASRRSPRARSRSRPPTDVRAAVRAA